MGNFEFLNKKRYIKKVEVLEFFHTENGRYYSIKITFLNNSTLSAKEYSSKKERNYSYHWQDEKENIICRWDNAPHHKHIKTYPHHLHKDDNIIESYSITIDDVIEYIERIIS